MQSEATGIGRGGSPNVRLGGFVVFAALLLVLLPAALPAQARTQAGSKLTAVTGSLPGAISGQSYSFRLTATGGTPPYVCTPQSLELGSLQLTSGCVITGTAPQLQKSTAKSVTGPFSFKLSDHSTPPQTVKVGPLALIVFQTKAGTDGPQFLLPTALADLHVKVGQKIDLSFCTPKPKPGHSCGGPFVHNQSNPQGGQSFSGPYTFRVSTGFLPTGLVLHSNGLLTGTVGAIVTKSRTWSFTICASDGFAPGKYAVLCQHDFIFVTGKKQPPPPPKPKPTPKPYPYDGDWTGSLTGVVTWATQPVTTENIDIPVDTAGVTDGTFELDNASDSNGSIFSIAGDAQGDDAQIPASGLVDVTFWSDLDIVPQSSDISLTYIGPSGSCGFSMQFGKSSATTVGTINCKGYTEHNTAATFTGTLSLTRTS